MDEVRISRTALVAIKEQLSADVLDLAQTIDVGRARLRNDEAEYTEKARLLRLVETALTPLVAGETPC